MGKLVVTMLLGSLLCACSSGTVRVHGADVRVDDTRIRVSDGAMEPSTLQIRPKKDAAEQDEQRTPDHKKAAHSSGFFRQARKKITFSSWPWRSAGR
jgi:hypothetical protein